MAKRLFIAVAIVAFAVCALAFAQTRKVTDSTKIGVVEVKRAEPVEDPTLRGVVKADGKRVIPWHINYQGYLTDDVGTPINGTVNMTFSIWTLSSGGSELWNEPQVVSVEDGLFNVVLGVSTPIPASVFELGESRWLELEVEAQTLSPRTEVTSVGYAYRAVKTDSADYAAASDMVDGFDASATPGPNDLFPLSYGDGQYVNEGQADAIDSPMILDGTIQRADAQSAFKAPYADTADYALNATADTDWGVTGNILHPVADYGLAMRSTNVLYGDSTHTHVNFGVACTTGTSGQNYRYCTVSGGLYNNAAFDFNTVGGGYRNTASGDWATVGGGYYNTASGVRATVAGGDHNVASVYWATVGGGYRDTVQARYGGVFSGRLNVAGDEAADTAAFVGGGGNNRATAMFATVAGGVSNTASGGWAAVGGGWGNTAATHGATVAGGETDTASGNRATVCGGRRNTASGDYSTVGGGSANIASGDYATVGGGSQNATISWYATVGGGSVNNASGDFAAVGGGASNTATGEWATVAGGASNQANGGEATVGGGRFNAAIADYATVGGGHSNTADSAYATVGGGWRNRASGWCAAVSGGYADTSAGDYGFTVGNNSIVPAAYFNSAAFNGQIATASAQTRVGTISKAAGSFTIDHPVDPMSRILNHYFVESPEMVLIYRGIARIGQDGHAVVHLPDYFDALNRNPMVQLTGVGTYDVFVAEEVSGNRFVIGGKPDTKVYWTVTGDRKDPSAEITRIIMPVEQPKDGDLAGRSLDDDFLATAKAQLERMGEAGRFHFRTARGREKYEASRRALENR